MLSTPADLARSALDAAPDAMIIIDPAGIICFANRQVSALFGYAHDEIIGQRVEMLMPERFRSRHVGHRERYVDSVRVRPMGVGLDLFGRRRDGTEFPVEISLSPIEDGERVLVAAAIRDVTDRKRAEAEVIIAREAAEAARGDRRSGARERRSCQPGQEPLSGHGQPRSAPAAADPGAAQRHAASRRDRTRRRRGAGAAGAGHRRDVAAAERTARHQQARVRRHQARADRLSPWPASSRSCAREFASLAANKGLKFEIETCADCVHSDPSLVEQILRNLVSNAIKYTREGWVRLRCLHEATLVRIEVLDTGIGIPADQLRYIYDEFYQVGVPTNSSRDGYGLGTEHRSTAGQAADAQARRALRGRRGLGLFAAAACEHRARRAAGCGRGAAARPRAADRTGACAAGGG